MILNVALHDGQFLHGKQYASQYSLESIEDTDMAFGAKEIIYHRYHSAVSPNLTDTPLHTLLTAPHIFLLALFRPLFAHIIRMLNSQAPNIQVIANVDNDINDETPIYADGKTETQEHERDAEHAPIITETRRPAEVSAEAVLQ